MNGRRHRAAAQGLRRYPWVQVVSHPENTGFAAGCNSGAAVATGEVVVFLNNDTLAVNVAREIADELGLPIAISVLGHAAHRPAGGLT